MHRKVAQFQSFVISSLLSRLTLNSICVDPATMLWGKSRRKTNNFVFLLRKNNEMYLSFTLNFLFKKLLSR